MLTLSIVPSVLSISRTSHAETLTFQDPRGDDDGWGKAKYPTGKDYSPGAFDLVGLEIRDDGDAVVFEAEVAQPITDPWTSKDWGGNGFSLQFVQVYLDLDGKARSGERKGVPGSWIEFNPDSYWEKVVLISPQPASKVRGEVQGKAKYLEKKVVVPERTEARGKKIVARVSKKDLGGAPSPKWGVQAVMLSNEGFAEKEDILSRRTNEIAGEHRFGGGCDGLGDPQIVDMLAGGAKGEASEAEAQHKALSGFKCGDTAKDAAPAKISVVRR
jgi:carbohydrate-binding DOMON domain-containing protein